MTISYSDSMSLLLLRWKGSLYKAVLRDLVVYYFLYYIVFAVHLFLLNERQKVQMRFLIIWFERGTGYIPLTFLLGFYVAGVVARWWEQFNWVSWPDKLMTVIAMTLPGDDNKAVRRTIARWSSLQAAMAWRSISVRTIKRFPTERHLVDSGLMTEQEYMLYKNVNAPYGKWFLPVMWITNALKKCYQEGRIDSVQQKMLLKQLMSYRDGFAMLYVYDWVKIPLVYTQVVAIATYGYFALCLIARQPFLDAEARKKEITIMVPIFTSLQMLFYIGWLKVGQYLANPFGEDDDDFELNYILDRNTQVAYMMAEDIDDQMPPLDEHLDKARYFLPHTTASSKNLDIPPKDPFADFKLSEQEMRVMSRDEMDELLKDKEEAKRFHGVARQIQLVRRLARTLSREQEESQDEAGEMQSFLANASRMPRRLEMMDSNSNEKTL